MTLSKISLKLGERRRSYWSEKLLCTFLVGKSPVPRKTDYDYFLSFLLPHQCLNRPVANAVQ